MNPLEKFVRKNNEHQIKLDFEGKKRRKAIPVALGILILYIVWAYFTGLYQGTFDGVHLHGTSNLIWMLVVMVSTATGALFFIYSIAIISYNNRFAAVTKLKIHAIKLMLLSGGSLLVAFSFFKLTDWLSQQVLDNTRAIARFLRLGYSETPVLFEFLIQAVILFIAIIYLTSFIGIASMPFRAKTDAEKYMRELDRVEE